MAVIETVQFRLKEGVDEAEFHMINERFQREVVPVLPGLQRREATCSPEGTWLLVLRYADMESATRAMQTDTSDVSHKLISLIDMSTMAVGHYQLISE